MKIWFQNRRARDRRERKDLIFRDSTSTASRNGSTLKKPVEVDDASSNDVIDGMNGDEEEEDIEVS